MYILFAFFISGIILSRCGGNGGTSQTGGGNAGTSLSPVWVFNEIPDLEHAEISRDGRYAIVASDEKVAFIDLVQKKKLYEYTLDPDDFYVDTVSISEKGFALAATSARLIVFSATAGIVANFSEINYPDSARFVSGYPSVFAPSGDVYFVHGNKKFQVPDNLIWFNPTTLYDGSNYYDNPDYDSANEMGVSGNGSIMAIDSSIYGKLRVFNGNNGKFLWSSPVDSDGGAEIAVSYDGNIIVTRDLSKVVVYTVNPPEILFTYNIRSPINGHHGVATSDSGNVIAIADMSRLTIFKNLSSTPAVVKETDEGEILDIEMSSDGSVIALASYFGGLMIYDSDGNLKYRHDSGKSFAFEEVSISADGKYTGCLNLGQFNFYQIQ